MFLAVMAFVLTDEWIELCPLIWRAMEILPYIDRRTVDFLSVKKEEK